MNEQDSLLQQKPIVNRDPTEYLQIVKKALSQTRSILSTVDPKGALQIQLYEVFKIFAGRINVNTAQVVESDSSDDDLQQTVAKSQAGDGALIVDQTKTIELLNIPAFIQYFKVTQDDEDFFEEVIA